MANALTMAGARLGRWPFWHSDAAKVLAAILVMIAVAAAGRFGALAGNADNDSLLRLVAGPRPDRGPGLVRPSPVPHGHGWRFCDALVEAGRCADRCDHLVGHDDYGFADDRRDCRADHLAVRPLWAVTLFAHAHRPASGGRGTGGSGPDHRRGHAFLHRHICARRARPPQPPARADAGHAAVHAQGRARKPLRLDGRSVCRPDAGYRHGDRALRRRCRHLHRPLVPDSGRGGARRRGRFRHGLRGDVRRCVRRDRSGWRMGRSPIATPIPSPSSPSERLPAPGWRLSRRPAPSPAASPGVPERWPCSAAQSQCLPRSTSRNA